MQIPKIMCWPHCWSVSTGLDCGIVLLSMQADHLQGSINFDGLLSWLGNEEVSAWCHGEVAVEVLFCARWDQWKLFSCSQSLAAEIKVHDICRCSPRYWWIINYYPEPKYLVVGSFTPSDGCGWPHGGKPYTTGPNKELRDSTASRPRAKSSEKSASGRSRSSTSSTARMQGFRFGSFRKLGYLILGSL